MPTIHIHADGKHTTYAVRDPGKSRLPALMARVRDAGSLRTQYDELISRMVRVAQYTLENTRDARTLDEDEGHDFHGNQHVKIHVQHAKEAHVLAVKAQQIKSQKQAVHALLSGGHPFTKEELAIAVGMDPKGKTINDYLTNLKNPKFAGPKGALNIQKTPEGMFYVALPDGSQAPPPDTKVNWGEVAQPAPPKEIAQPPAPEPPPPPPPPAPPPVVHAPPVQPPVYPPLKPPSHEDIWQKHVDVMLGAGTLTHAQADTSYAAAMNAAWDDLQEMAKDGEGAWTAMTEWKRHRAVAMAAWAQAVHGTPFKTPPPPQIFKADEQLYKDVKAGKSQQDALAAWKKNTSLEKAGLFPPGVAKPPPPVAPPVAAPVPSALPPAVPVKPLSYDALVPASHVPIGAKDILDGAYEQGVNVLHANMMSDGMDAHNNKMKVENALRARLIDKPNYQAFVKRLGLADSGIGSPEGRLVQAWAHSSGDHQELSCALQMACKDAFAMPDTAVTAEPLKAFTDMHFNNVDALTLSAANGMRNSSKPPFTKNDVPTIRAALQEFVQAQYANTQDYFKKKGLKYVHIARGMEVKANTAYSKVGPSALKLQPASSFSTHYPTARSFAGVGGTVFLAKIPVQQILGTFHSGFGCTGEHELVVLGHDKIKAYPVPKHVATSHWEAQNMVKDIINS